MKDKLLKQRLKAEKEIVKLQRIKESMKETTIDSGTPVKLQIKEKQKKEFGTYKTTRNARRRLKKKRDEAYLVTIWFNNGTQITDILTTTEKTFTFKKKTYYLFSEECRQDLRMNMPHFYFFENYPCPVNREIRVDNKNEPYALVTPSSLGDLIKGEYIRILAGSHNFSRLLKVLILIGVINIGVSVIIAFMMYKGGAV